MMRLPAAQRWPALLKAEGLSLLGQQVSREAYVLAYNDTFLLISVEGFSISEAAEIMALELRNLFGQRVLGPSIPTIGRIRNQYLHVIYIKMEKDSKLIRDIKQAIKTFQAGIVKKKSLSSVRILVDVDPYH